MKSCALASYRSCRKSKMDDFGEKVPKIKVWILLTLFFFLSTVIKEQRLKIGLKFMQKFVF